MKILIEIKSAYGNELIYPACESAKTFAKIAGSKTLTRSVINDIKKLGYSIEIKQQSL